MYAKTSWKICRNRENEKLQAMYVRAYCLKYTFSKYQTLRIFASVNAYSKLDRHTQDIVFRIGLF